MVLHWSESYHCVLQAHAQLDHTPPSPPVSPQQTTTPRNWFFLSSFTSICLVEASSCSALFFSPDRLFQGGPLTIHWFNRQKIDPISFKSAFSALISWHLDCPRWWKNTGLSGSHTNIQKNVLHPLVFWKCISASATQKGFTRLDDFLFFFVKWSHEAVTVTERMSVLSHLETADMTAAFPQRANHNIYSVLPLRETW